MSKLPPAVGKKPEALKTDPVTPKIEKPKPLVAPKPKNLPIPPPKPLPKPETPQKEIQTSPQRPKVGAKPSHLASASRDPQITPATASDTPISPKQASVKMPPPATPKRDFLKPQPPPSREQSRERSTDSRDRNSDALSRERVVSPVNRSPARSPAPPPPKSRDQSRRPVSRDTDGARDTERSRDPPPIQRKNSDLGGSLLVASAGREGAVAPVAPVTSRDVSENISRDASPRGRALPQVTRREGAIAPLSARVPSIVEPESPLAVRKSRESHVTTPEQVRSSHVTTPEQVRSSHVSPYATPAPPAGDRVTSSYTPPAPVKHLAESAVSRESSTPPVQPPRPDNGPVTPAPVVRESAAPPVASVSRDPVPPTPSRDIPPPTPSRDIPPPTPSRDYVPPPPPTSASAPASATASAASTAPPSRDSTSSTTSRDPPAVRKPLPDPSSFAAPPVHHAVASRREELKREEQSPAPALPRRRDTDIPVVRDALPSRDPVAVVEADFPPPPRRATDSSTPRYSRQSSTASIDSRDSRDFLPVSRDERHGSTSSLDHLRHPERIRQSSTTSLGAAMASPVTNDNGIYSSKSVLQSHLEPPPTRQTVLTSDAGELDNELNPSAAIDGYQDYPDTSSINRKPPTNPRRPQLSLKHDVKCMDSNEEYLVACSSGYTFVLSSDSLELLFSEPHNDLKISTVLVTSTNHCILGFKEGELWEVDLDDGTVSVKRATSHTTPIVLIHESPNGLYSVSEDGRVCVWPGDDESPLCGTPKQHKLSFGFIRHAVGVEDTIWVGKSRNAFIFHESMNFMNPLVVSSTVPGNRPSLDFSCIFYDAGHVYFGHENGNITVFSTSTTQVVAQKFVTPSCPQTLFCRQGMVWIGFKNGLIQIINTKEPQWKIIKSFEGHQSGVSGIAGSSRAVASFGSSPNLRFWDALLLEYWEDDHMSKRQDEYCDYQNLSVGVITWNCGAIKPSQMQRAKKNDKYWIDQSLEEAGYPDIVVFGFQELVELSDKGLSAKALLGLHKKDDISDQYQLWEDELTHLMGRQYRRVKCHYLVGLFAMVFAREELPTLGHVQCSEVKTGLGGYHGNKGAVCIRFTLADSSLCFVNVHLAAGQSKVSDRVKDLESCFSKDLFKKDARDEDVARVYINGGDGSLIGDHENLFILGDMNFRVNQHPKLAVQHVNNGRFEKLLQSDQLTIQMKKNISFPLRSFSEHDIAFAPTYKFDVGTDTYDSSEKKRVPSWCDRILYRGNVECLSYDAKVVRLSDHRPVVGRFDVRVKRIDEDKWEMVRLEVRKELMTK